MRNFGLLSLGCLIGALPAQAATIDLTDGFLTPLSIVTISNPGRPDTDGLRSFSETESGVTFMFIATATNDPSGVIRFGNPALSSGIKVGGTVGGSSEFELEVDHDVILTGYGTNDGLGLNFGYPTFDLLDGDGSTILLDDANIRNPAGTSPSGPDNILNVTGLSIALFSGTTYTFDINGAGPFADTHTSRISSFEFDVVNTGGGGDPSVVPLPPAAPLLAGGLGFFGVLGWRRRLNS